tara:strand:- start:1263 stop:1421 length:159 start_codon:yes stop_codon:yes gene_type:complete
MREYMRRRRANGEIKHWRQYQKEKEEREIKKSKQGKPKKLKLSSYKEHLRKP